MKNYPACNEVKSFQSVICVISKMYSIYIDLFCANAMEKQEILIL